MSEKPAAGHTDTQPNGMLGGVYAGYHHQLPNRLVLGADADFVMSNAADMKRRESIDTPGATDAANMDSQDILWTVALRARAGYAIDRWMPYLSIGGSLAKVDQLVRNFGTDHHIGATTFAGWTLGAGVEYALNNNITLRADYRHSDFGDKTIQSRDLPPINWHLKTHDIRFGIAYTF